MKYLILALTMIFLASCTGTSYKMNDLSIGMTKEDVISALGKPVSVSAKDGTEYLNYRFSENSDQEFVSRLIRSRRSGVFCVVESFVCFAFIT